MFRYEISTEEDVKKVYADINASKESIETGVEYLMEWLKQQPHLPSITDKEFLTFFLVGCKNSLEKAKTRLNNYYIYKAQIPEIYMNRDPCSEGFKRSMRALFTVPLPKLTPDGYRIFVNGFGVYNPEDNPTVSDVLKLYSSIIDLNVKTDLVKGYISIYDLANVNISSHKLLLSTWTVLLRIMQNAVPIRLHQIYFLNLSPTIHFFVNAGLIFLGEKLSNRVIEWKKDPKDLIEVFPKEILPVEYGGVEQSLDELKDNILERLIFYRDWLKASEGDKADLTKLQNHSSSAGAFSLEEIQGSFRKLTFD